VCLADFALGLFGFFVGGHGGVFDDATPVGGELGEGRKFLRGRDVADFPALEGRPGESLSGKPQLFAVDAGVAEEGADVAGAVLHEPENAVERIDKRGLRAVRARQGWRSVGVATGCRAFSRSGWKAEVIVGAPVGEVQKAVFGLFLLDQRPGTLREGALAVEFNMGAIGEDDGFPGVEFDPAVGVAPEDVEAGGGIDTRKAGLAVAVAAGFFREAGQDAIENDGLNFGEKPLGRDFLPVGKFNAGMPSEGVQPSANAGNDEIRPADSHLQKGGDALADDLLEFGPDRFVIRPGGVFGAFAGSQENAGGKGRIATVGNAGGGLGVEGPSFGYGEAARRMASTRVAHPRVVLWA